MTSYAQMTLVVSEGNCYIFCVGYYM